MTRRERMIRVFHGFGTKQRAAAMDRMVERLGLNAFTDDAIDELARTIVSEWKYQNRRNEQNRRLSEWHASHGR